MPHSLWVGPAPQLWPRPPSPSVFWLDQWGGGLAANAAGSRENGSLIRLGLCRADYCPPALPGDLPWAGRQSQPSHGSPWLSGGARDVTTMGPGPTCPVPSLPSLLPLLQPRGPPRCSSQTPGPGLPQGLCTSCALCLEHSSPHIPLGPAPFHLSGLNSNATSSRQPSLTSPVTSSPLPARHTSGRCFLSFTPLGTPGNSASVHLPVSCLPPPPDRGLRGVGNSPSGHLCVPSPWHGDGHSNESP